MQDKRRMSYKDTSGKTITVLALSFLVGCPLYSMEDQKGLFYLISLLPKEIRNQIVAFTLQAQVGLKYELFSRINAGIPICSVVFHPNGTTFATGSSDDAIVRLWSLSSGKELKRFTGHTAAITSVVFSPDGKAVLTGSKDATARLVDVATGIAIQLFKGHRDIVNSVAFNPNGKTVLTGSFDETACLWDSSTGKQLQLFTGHTDAVNSVAFSPDGRVVLTGSYDTTARLWDVTTGKELKKFTGHTGPLSSVAFSPDGKTALTGSFDRTARLWDISTGKEVQQFIGITNPVATTVAFSKEGKTIIAGSYNETARLWDVTTGKEIQLLAGHNDLVTSALFSSTGIIALGSHDGAISLWGLNFTLAPHYQKEAYILFKDKGLYRILEDYSYEEADKQAKEEKKIFLLDDLDSSQEYRSKEVPCCCLL